MVRAWIGVVVLGCGALGACSSSGSDSAETTVAKATTNAAVTTTSPAGVEGDLPGLVTKLEGAGFACDAPEPAEASEDGVPPAIDQVRCTLGSTATQVTRWSSAEDADLAEGVIQAFATCDPKYIPVTYVDGGPWLAVSDATDDELSKTDAFAAIAKTNAELVGALGGAILTPNDCKLVD